MKNIYFGCDAIPGDWEDYAKLCNLAEIDLGSLPSPPKASTLQRWRSKTPKGFAFALHAHREFVEGILAQYRSDSPTLSDEMRRGWEQTVKRASHLSAKSIIIQLENDFAPGATSRKLIDLIAANLADQTDAAIAMDLRGPWPMEKTRDQIDQRQLVYAYDPFVARREKMEFSHGDACFILTERPGMRRKYEAHDLRSVLGWADNFDRTFTLLRGRFKWEHARIFRDVCGEELAHRPHFQD